MILGVLAAGCSAEVGNGGPVTAKSEGGEVRDESLGGLVTSTVSSVGQTAGVCAPLTCCFPAGAEWGDNPFENSLRSLGCTTPQAYTERYGATTWWMFSSCPLTPAIVNLVAQYSNVAPYQSTWAVNACLYLNEPLLSGQVFVEFDPTCASCQAVRR